MIKMKYWALLAILPLFVGIIIGISIQSSQAQLDEPRLGAALAPQSYGAATEGIVCGDRLCSDSTPVAPMPIAIRVIEDSMPEYMPTLGFKSLSKFEGDSSNTYAVEFTVTAAQKNLRNVKIICSTDVETIETEITSLNALQTTTNLLRIRAMDPASITGEIISFQIAAPFRGGPLVVAPEPEPVSLSLQQIAVHDPISRTDKDLAVTGDLKTFSVIYYVVNVGGGDVQNVEILVSSDAETVSGLLEGFLDPTHSIISVAIKAYDPFSITAEIVRFES